MNQKTIRILLYKFQEGIHADKSDDQEMKALVSEHKQTDYCRDKELEQIKRYIQEQTRAVESVSGAEEAMRFLYACLDDIELENASGTQVRVDTPETGSRMNPEGGQSGLPSSLDQLTPLQRQELLINLLRTAISLRAVAQNSALRRSRGDVFSTISCGSLSAEGREAVSVEDILNLSVERGHFDEFHCRSVSTRKLVSIGVQTEAMNLEERLAMDIKERLRPCSSLGVVK